MYKIMQSNTIALNKRYCLHRVTLIGFGFCQRDADSAAFSFYLQPYLFWICLLFLTESSYQTPNSLCCVYFATETCGGCFTVFKHFSFDRFVLYEICPPANLDFPFLPISDAMLIANDRISSSDTRATPETHLNFLRRCQDHMPRPFHDQ